MRKEGEIEDGVQKIVFLSRSEQSRGLKYDVGYSGDLRNENHIKAFLTLHSTDNMEVVNTKVDNLYTGDMINIILALPLPHLNENEFIEDKMDGLVKDFFNLRRNFLNKGKLMLLNVTESTETNIRKKFQLSSESTTPYLLAVYPQKDKEIRKKFVFQGEVITQKSVVDFFESVKNGKAKQVIFSEIEEPKNKQDRLLVKSVCANNWATLIDEFDGDVIALFYGIGCHDCVEMKKQFYTLAYRMKHVKNLRFVRINGKMNTLPDYVEAKRTPSIFMFRNGFKNQPGEFFYAKTQQSIIENLKNTVTFDWVEPLELKDVNKREIIYDKTFAEKEHEVNEEKRRIQREKEEKEKEEKERIKQEQEKKETNQSLGEQEEIEQTQSGSASDNNLSTDSDQSGKQAPHDQQFSDPDQKKEEL